MTFFLSRLVPYARAALAGLAAALLLGLSPAAAETYTFLASLSGASEVPPNGSKATGSLTATYDTTTKKLTWTVTYSDLSGPPFAAHFHGPAGPARRRRSKSQCRSARARCKARRR